ncbi:hypothetical protein [Bradyrhizobium sp. AZCC 2289]|uniref:hypothetical protein n=1 Tax=Bradyrhizobium sp. AZCC 2289 TaxID=3117026 RepID=UPI002FEE7A75
MNPAGAGGRTSGKGLPGNRNGAQGNRASNAGGVVEFVIWCCADIHIFAKEWSETSFRGARSANPESRDFGTIPE